MTSTSSCAAWVLQSTQVCGHVRTFAMQTQSESLHDLGLCFTHSIKWSIRYISGFLSNHLHPPLRYLHQQWLPHPPVRLGSCSQHKSVDMLGRSPCKRSLKVCMIWGICMQEAPALPREQAFNPSSQLADLIRLPLSFPCSIWIQLGRGLMGYTADYT